MNEYDQQQQPVMTSKGNKYSVSGMNVRTFLVMPSPNPIWGNDVENISKLKLE